MNTTPIVSDWIAHVFDHEVTNPPWHRSFDAAYWHGSPEDIAAVIAETFERSGELLASFTDAQLNQGLWYIIDASYSDFMFALVDLDVPLKIRLRAIRSIVPLFEQIMAKRCSPHLSHRNERPANPLNSVCYMWWDVLPIHGRPEVPERAEFDAETLRVLTRLLSIPHDACRESALHGISEWRLYYRQATTIVDNWLKRTPGLRPELVSYAQRAKFGNVL